ncbi:MAG: UDP-glucose/GDP-mannose dehydrogenase family protein [Proteobacteria bacterium]|nr:UDP-glucose/GDP-mannose dehydrogenase family protein [Pseudomonadota bacterium]
MRIAMIGTGYVGLVTGACFSEFGIEVVCVDTDESKISALKNGVIPIYEPGLDALVDKSVKAGLLSFTTNLADTVPSCDAVFIAVGTPSRRGDGHADLSYVYAAAEEIARVLDGFTVVVTKSTVPVGTGDEVERLIREARPDAEFAVVSNPEFLQEGSAIVNFTHPDRVVIGGADGKAREIIRELYRPLFLHETPILFTERRTAELIKYAANTFLATKITFINQIADLCEAVGADVQDVAKGIGLDGRIGGKFLHPGPGYGGSCFPKDTEALVKTAQDFKKPMTIVESVVAANANRKLKMADKVIEACGGSVEGRSIAVLGLTFKQNTDDMRDSPSLAIVPRLVEAGADVRVFDPEGMDEARKLLDGVTWCKDIYSTLGDAHAVVIVTEWNLFRSINLDRAKSLMTVPCMIDLRNIYNPDDMVNAGFTYHSIGRPSRSPGDS